ncbi:Uncharacterized protein Fot_10904 [Forsythia ovata]|uniref:Uncharacterized protein n=1 Tax=Forsythia ovata TaxID=205694 RepID=A0ABD1WI61_9LAMI
MAYVSKLDELALSAQCTPRQLINNVTNSLKTSKNQQGTVSRLPSKDAEEKHNTERSIGSKIPKNQLSWQNEACHEASAEVFTLPFQSDNQALAMTSQSFPIWLIANHLTIWYKHLNISITNFLNE